MAKNQRDAVKPIIKTTQHRERRLTTDDIVEWNRSSRSSNSSALGSVKKLKGTIVGIRGEVILIGSANKPENHMTSFEKMEMIRSGVSKKDLENLKQKAKLDYAQLANALSVTRATLINKKGKAKFGTSVSEKIVGLADIYSYGYEVFEDKERFNEWIFKPNQALKGLTPYNLLSNQYGREEVKSLIGRIDYGVYS